MTDEQLSTFLREHYYTEMRKSDIEERSLVIDFNDLDRYTTLADQLLETPEQVLKDFKKAAELSGVQANIRIKNLPERRRIRIRNLRAKHLGRLWEIDAIIKSASEVKPQIYEATFKCPECSTLLVVPQETNIVKRPLQCGAPYAPAGCGRRGDFEMQKNQAKLVDIRWLNGIEPFEVTSGEQPGELLIFLKDDLTTPRMQRKTDPGNRLKITGVLKDLPKHIKGRLSTRLDMYVEAVYAEHAEIEYDEFDISPEEERLIRELAAEPGIYEKLRASIAPSIYGFEEIKESLLLQLFGGVPHYLPDGTRIRGNIHMLLTGDPGIGKTVLLKLISGCVPRGKYVSGSGITGVGMTASVRKDETLGGWVLEAGALILANKSLISIDEFDKISRDDQIALHEAMSVETVSVAKAGIVATLPAQTAVLAGANPKLGRFDPFMSIPEQIMIPETLLSRFDLKFALRDRPDKAVDERLAEHIIISRKKPELIAPPVEMSLLRKYIAYAKQIREMELTDEAAERIKNFYLEMRSRYADEEVQTISITLRQYEALIRLAEASAKIRLDTQARVQDAERAIALMKYSLMQLGTDMETGRIDIDRLESGITASRRRKIGVVVGIITSLQKGQKDVAVEDVKAEAQTQGIENIDDVLEHLRNEGTIFEPRPGYVRKV